MTKKERLTVAHLPGFKQGRYILTADFIPTKVDGRKGAYGWRGYKGIPKDTLVRIQRWWGRRGDELDPSWEIVAPDLLYLHDGLILHPLEGDRFVSPGPLPGPDIERLFGLLAPEDSHVGWLLETTDAGIGQRGGYRELLELLLEEGTITREQVGAVATRAKARTEGEET